MDHCMCHILLNLVDLIHHCDNYWGWYYKYFTTYIVFIFVILNILNWPSPCDVTLCLALSQAIWGMTLSTTRTWNKDNNDLSNVQQYSYCCMYSTVIMVVSHVQHCSLKCTALSCHMYSTVMSHYIIRCRMHSTVVSHAHVQHCSVTFTAL